MDPQWDIQIRMVSIQINMRSAHAFLKHHHYWVILTSIYLTVRILLDLIGIQALCFLYESHPDHHHRILRNFRTDSATTRFNHWSQYLDTGVLILNFQAGPRHIDLSCPYHTNRISLSCQYQDHLIADLVLLASFSLSIIVHSLILRICGF